MAAFWKFVTISPTAAKLPCPSATSSEKRLAPAQKASGASLPITRPTPSRSARSTPVFIIATMSGSSAFILAWNSRQKTPSPMSSSEALGFRSTSAVPAPRFVARTRSRTIRPGAAARRIGPVEPHALALGGDLFLHPAGHLVARRLHLRGGGLHAQRVPGLEGALLPAEAPAHGAVDRVHVVGDLAQPVGRVDQRLVGD